jgi:hypothetical protein
MTEKLNTIDNGNYFGGRRHKEPASTNSPQTAVATVERAGAVTLSPIFTGWLGVSLVAIGVLALLGMSTSIGSSFSVSLYFAAISGATILSLTLVGLIVLTRAIGLADSTQALGLPRGSVRALLALLLTIVFVATASWTLGGLFDPIGPMVAEDSTGNMHDQIHRDYGTEQYIIFDVQKGDKTASKVYLRREAPSSSVIDISKQVVTITATVLVTLVGFYFGSKSASDAVQAAHDSLNQMGSVLSKSDLGTGDYKTPSSQLGPNDIDQAASAIAAFAKTAQASLRSFGDAPLDLLHQAIAETPSAADALKQPLNSAETNFAKMTSAAKAITDANGQAQQVVNSTVGADPTRLSQLVDQMKGISSGATEANHDFQGALKLFEEAQRTILATTAKG